MNFKVSTDALQDAYERGRKLERRRWIKNLRRWLKQDEDDRTLGGSVWIDAILEKISELARKPRAK